MALSRRSFLNVLAAGGVSASSVAARGLEAAVAEASPSPPPRRTEPGGLSEVHIDSNENPVGPSPKALAALVRALEYAGRYPPNGKPSAGDLRDALAQKLSVAAQNVVLGAGSQEVLRNAVRIWTSSARHFVTAAPSYERPERAAEQLGVPVMRIRVDSAGRLDLQRMADAARWAGLVFVCNPNNPTGTLHPARAISDFVARVRRESPETAILIDEAYHDYVTDPGYATALPLALEHPNVIVTRTFSKAYGMAGLRIGYAVGQARTIEGLARWAMTFNQSVLGVAAATAGLDDTAYVAAERIRNANVRGYTTRFFQDAGFKVLGSEANFLFVDIQRPARAFKEACTEHGVFVGREFPPLDKTCARVSIGTIEEMTRATAVFARVLGPAHATGGSQ